MPNDPLAGLSILVVEDDVLLRKQIAAHLESHRADVTGAATIEAARRLVGELEFDFVLLDVHLPDGLGTDLLKERRFPPNVGIIVMTGDGGVAGAVEAMRLGALDYLAKPFEVEELPLVLARARRARQSARLDEHRRVEAGGQAMFFGAALAGLELQLGKILAADRRMQTDLSPVLIQGETGTGKTSIARWLHQQGPRASQPLVEVNCSALPETLAESELFGHERGAFTDARTGRIGLFEAAHGGSLFLDELPSLSPLLQAKVLSAIEDRRIRRVGGNKLIPVDARVIAATNRDLLELVAQGQFREDLYHRLDLYRVCMPPLRERGEDILKLAELLVRRICQRHRLPVRKVTSAGAQRLLAHRWPGNVRELAHELERAIVFEESAELDFHHLQPGDPGSGDRALPPTDCLNPNFTFPPSGFSLDDTINRLVDLALKQADGNVSAAARLLGVTRDYVRYRLSGHKTGSPEEQGS
jgi:two-component system, NtrC family, response regulator AtoC